MDTNVTKEQLDELVYKYGEDVISKAMLKSMQSFEDDIIVFNGMRLPSDYDYLKKAKGILIYITADPKLRWERVVTRKEKSDDTEPFEKFKEMHKRKTEISVPRMGEKADYHIENTGTLEDLREKVKEVMEKILKEEDTTKKE